MKKGIFIIFCFVASLSIFVLLDPSLNRAWGAEEKYPSRPIELYCAYSAGGYADSIMRFLGKGLEKYLKVVVIPGNKPGGGEVIAATNIINSAPDGYTLSTLSDGYILLAPLLGLAIYSKEDLRVVGQFIFTSLVMSVSTESPWKTFQEFIDYARKNPGLTCGSYPVGTSMFIRTEYLNKVANLKMRCVPFKADPEIISAILGKHVNIGITSYIVAKRQADAGKIRILFTFDPPGLGPDPSLPNVSSFFGKDVFDIDPPAQYLVAPGKTPENIIKVLEQTLEKVTKDPEFINNLRKLYAGIQFIDGKTLHDKILEKRTLQIKPILQEAGLIK